MKRIFVIFKKELVDTVRDRKAMFFMVIFPILLFPLIIGVTVKIHLNVMQKEQDKTLNLAFINKSDDTILEEMFLQDTSLQILKNIPINTADSLITADSIDAAIIIEENFLTNIQNYNTGNIQLHFQTKDELEIAIKRIKNIINTYSETILTNRMAELNISQEILEPIQIIDMDLATSREKLGKTLGKFLPYLFILFCFTGAMYPALDLGAGEKERGTLETLLVAPATRLEILYGKFGVIAFAGIASAMFSLAGILGSVTFIASIPEEIISFALGVLQPATILILISLLFPLTIFFAAMLLIFSIYANSFKEAQSISQPLMILVFIPIMLGSIIPGIHLDNLTALIPIMNVSLACKEVISGTAEWIPMIIVYISSFTIAGISIYFCSKWFERESVIFRN